MFFLCGLGTFTLALGRLRDMHSCCRLSKWCWFAFIKISMLTKNQTDRRSPRDLSSFGRRTGEVPVTLCGATEGGKG